MSRPLVAWKRPGMGTAEFVFGVDLDGVVADFIQGLLLEEGIPSLQRRARGFDVPDFLAAGPRDVLVPESGAPAAREVLLQSELIGEEQTARPWSATAWRVLLALLAGLALLGALAWLFSGH